MSTQAAKIGFLQAESERQNKDIDRLSESNGRRKEENIAMELNINTIQHTVEETNTLISQVAESMEELKQSMIEMQKSFSHMDSRISVLEGKQFDWPKFMAGLVTPRGMILAIIFSISATIMFLAVVAPESLPVFLDLVDRKAPGISEH